MRIILIGNYPPDGQQSMERFTLMLRDGFREVGHVVETWRPLPVFGRLVGSTTTGLGKWLGYIDKWLLFPLILRIRRIRHPASAFHVCDHSNSPYLAHLPAARSSITCHDVLAMRGAFGHDDAYCPASKAGVFLQRWILSGLARAKKVATVSQLTMIQLQELAKSSFGATWTVIPNAFNERFWPMTAGEAEALLADAGMAGKDPYLLHVGSALPRKNRALLLQLAAALGPDWTGTICFAGAPLDKDLKAQAARMGLADRVVEVTGPDHRTLVALYSRCEAFVFPSFSEGFGWPLIEAQACGAPVIASDVEPMPEVSGDSALHADPNDPSAFAAALSKLGDPACRAEVVRDGYENCKRFAPDRMISAYLRLMEVQ